MRRNAALIVSIVGLAAVLAMPCHAGVWEASSIGVGGGGGWLTVPGDPTVGNLELVGRAAVSVTPHVAIVGGGAYGFQDSYLRGSAGARITATDVNDQSFSIGIGISRHFASEDGFSLDEWAGEAGLGWKPLVSSRFLLTALLAYGLDSGNSFVSAAVVYPLRRPGGSQ